MCASGAPGIVGSAEPAATRQPSGEHTTMHAFITGHLADARIADFEREAADAALRAQLRAASGTRPSRRDAIAGSLRRLAAGLLPSLSGAAPTAAIDDTGAPPPLGGAMPPAGFVARL